MTDTPMTDVTMAVAAALLSGATLQVAEVSAGNGLVIDWRTIRCGEVIVEAADTFTVAVTFVELVGLDAAWEAVS